MITKIVERTNDQLRKVRKKINADEFLFQYNDKNNQEIVCLFVLLYFRGLHQNSQQEFRYDTFPAMKTCRAAMCIKQIRVANENNKNL